MSEGDLVSLLPASGSVGSIRTRCPTLYVFSGGNEDAAFFTINGFSILLDGGDQREVPFWNLIRNYDKVSAVVNSRSSPESMRGIATILARKAQEECYPMFGAFIGNLPPRDATTGDSETAKLLRGIYEGLQAEGLKAIEAVANPKMETITLYEVIGEGALRMTVLHPEKGSKELGALAAALKAGESVEKLSVATSIALLLVWHPSDPSKPTTRILFPGACPLDRLYAALEKLKGEEYLRHVEFVSSDREKFASNLSLNSRGIHPSSARAGGVATAHKVTTPARPAPAAKPAAQKTPVASARGGATTRGVTTGASSAVPPSSRLSRPAPAATESHAKKPVRHTTAAAAPARPGMLGSSAPGMKKSAPSPASKTTPKPHADGGASKVGPKTATNGAAKPSAAGGTKPVPIRRAGAAAGGVDEAKAKDAIAKEPTIPAVSPIPVVKETPPEPEPEKKVTVETFAAESPAESEKPKTPPQSPQIPGDNGLLDDIEVPMQVRRISMDTSGEEHPPQLLNVDAVGDAVQGEQHGEADLLISTSPEVPPAFPAVAEAHEAHSPRDTALTPPAALTEQKSHIEELLESGACPFTAGLVSQIVDDATSESLQHQQSPLEPCGVKPSAPSPLDDDLAAAAAIAFDPLAEALLSDGLGNLTSATDKAFTVAASSSLGNGISAPTVSHGSANAQSDSALDDVIESLAGESELEDRPKAAAAISHEVIHEKVKYNGGGDLLSAQDAQEDAHATPQYLPAVRPHARAATGGAVAKPKLSQPLYFDVVFVPHHGSQPALHDEAAAKAFAISVRSKRYVISGENAMKTHILDGFVAAKNVWNKPELEIDVLPTHSSDMLSAYNQLKAGEMSEAGMNLRCSVDRCTLRLSSGGSDDCCAAFKFEM